MDAVILPRDAGEAAFVPVQRQVLATQRQVRGDARNERHDVIVRRMARQLLGQPVAVLLQETIPGDQAGAPGQRESRTALVDAQLQPLGARVADALHLQPPAIVQFQRHGVAFDAAGRTGDQAVEHGRHARIIAAAPGARLNRPC